MLLQTEAKFTVYEYTDFVPGPIVKDTDGIINEIRKAEKEFNPSKTVSFKNKFMSACDGNSAKRIFDEMIR